MKKKIKIGKRNFIYDPKNCVLNYVDSKGEIVSSIGLSKSNWKEDPKYWAEKYNDELNEELIAKFMGAEPNLFTIDKNGSRNYSYELYFGNIDEEVIKPECMRFHSSWSWLMPVIEKIESLRYEVNIKGTCCTMYRQHNKFSLFEFSEKSKMDATYRAVIEFIEWYNKEKENE